MIASGSCSRLNSTQACLNVQANGDVQNVLRYYVVTISLYSETTRSAKL